MPERIEVEFIGKDKLSGVARSAGSALDRFGASALKIGGTAIVGGLAAAGTAIAGLSIAALDLAKQAAPVEAIQSAFNGLAGSIGRSGDEMLKTLQKTSGGMVASRDLMTSFNKAAQLVSTDFAVRLPDAMGMLQKAAAATGQDMGFMLDSLVTGIGRSSPMILDNLGIQVDLAAATQAAADKFGVQSEELTKGQIQMALFDQVLLKLTENTAAMPDITDTASAAMARWTATTQDLKDEIGLAFVPILNELATEALPILKEEIAPLIREMLPGIIELVGGATKIFLEFAADLAGTVRQAVAIINETLRDFGFETDTSTILLNVFRDILYTVVTAVQIATMVVGGWIVILGVLKSMWDKLTQSIRWAIDAIRRFFDWLQRVRSIARNSFNFSIPGFQQGGSFVVPPGFPNDSFLMGVTSGERVSVEPVAPVTNNFNMTVNSMAATSSVVQDFNMMRAIVG